MAGAWGKGEVEGGGEVVEEAGTWGGGRARAVRQRRKR